MGLLPTPTRVKSAREGLIAANGRLPQGWVNENADAVTVDHVDLSPEGPAITLTIAFAAGNPAPFVSMVLGDYLPVPNEEVGALRVDLELTHRRSVAAAFLVVREWIAGGTYVGQATRTVPIGAGMVAAVAARMALGDERLFQPVLSLRRDGAGAGQATVRLRRVTFDTLHAHPAWLAA